VHCLIQIVENGLSDPEEDTAKVAVQFLREYLLKDTGITAASIATKKGGKPKAN
jgi:hypothetical protein